MLYSARVVSQKDSLGFTVYLRAPFRTPLCYRNLADPFSILFLLQGKEERPSRLYRFVVLSFELLSNCRREKLKISLMQFLCLPEDFPPCKDTTVYFGQTMISLGFVEYICLT